VPVVSLRSPLFTLDEAGFITAIVPDSQSQFLLSLLDAFLLNPCCPLVPIASQIALDLEELEKGPPPVLTGVFRFWKATTPTYDCNRLWAYFFPLAPADPSKSPPFMARIPTSFLSLSDPEFSHSYSFYPRPNALGSPSCNRLPIVSPPQHRPHQQGFSLVPFSPRPLIFHATRLRASNE